MTFSSALGLRVRRARARGFFCSSAHQLARDRVDRDDLLLGDADDVVVERRAAHDRVGGLLEVARSRRRPPAGCPGRRRSPSCPMFIACLTTTGPPVTTTRRTSGCFIRSCALSTVGCSTDVITSRGPPAADDRLVEQVDEPVADPRRRRVHVEDDRVAAGDHADRVAEDRLGRVGRRRDREDHAVRRALGEHQAVVAGVRDRRAGSRGPASCRRPAGSWTACPRSGRGRSPRPRSAPAPRCWRASTRRIASIIFARTATGSRSLASKPRRAACDRLVGVGDRRRACRAGCSGADFDAPRTGEPPAASAPPTMARRSRRRRAARARARRSPRSCARRSKTRTKTRP